LIKKQGNKFKNEEGKKKKKRKVIASIKEILLQESINDN